MIEYKQLDEGKPRNVLVSTDDNDAEMIKLDEMIKECGFEISLPNDRSENGRFEFILPGAMVGEFADCMYDIDNGLLEESIEEWNQKALDE